MGKIDLSIAIVARRDFHYRSCCSPSVSCKDWVVLPKSRCSALGWRVRAARVPGAPPRAATRLAHTTAVTRCDRHRTIYSGTCTVYGNFHRIFARRSTWSRSGNGWHLPTVILLCGVAGSGVISFAAVGLDRSLPGFGKCLRSRADDWRHDPVGN